MSQLTRATRATYRAEIWLCVLFIKFLNPQFDFIVWNFTALSAFLNFIWYYKLYFHLIYHFSSTDFPSIHQDTSKRAVYTWMKITITYEIMSNPHFFHKHILKNLSSNIFLVVYRGEAASSRDPLLAEISRGNIQSRDPQTDRKSGE